MFRSRPSGVRNRPKVWRTPIDRVTTTAPQTTMIQARLDIGCEAGSDTGFDITQQIDQGAPPRPEDALDTPLCLSPHRHGAHKGHHAVIGQIHPLDPAVGESFNQTVADERLERAPKASS